MESRAPGPRAQGLQDAILHEVFLDPQHWNEPIILGPFTDSRSGIRHEEDSVWLVVKESRRVLRERAEELKRERAVREAESAEYRAKIARGDIEGPPQPPLAQPVGAEQWDDSTWLQQSASFDGSAWWNDSTWRMCMALPHYLLFCGACAHSRLKC